ncbi:Kelch-like ECH-associated protein 1 [Lamellibrachia satsuma]|nr:Kelch-like ECH-associated protein 1 [Lamellibrachia satsuma]
MADNKDKPSVTMLGPGCYKPKPVSADKPMDGSMHFTITKQPKEALEVMNVLRQNKKLCDVSLKAESRTFPAHKLVLAAASPYFKAMFCTSGMRESEMIEIPLQGVTASVLGTLIDFAYTSEINVSELNVCALLPAATMFQIVHVVEACCTFLEHQLDPSNCIGIADFAQAHGCHLLYNKARQYIYQNFSRVCRHDEFMHLSSTQLIQVIKRDELNVRCESEVYMAVMSWVKYKEDQRLGNIEQLLSAVRCHFLTPQFINMQLRYCDMLLKVPHCMEYLRRTYDDLVLHRKCPDRRRHNPNAPPVIYTIGGYLRHSLSHVECYNPQSNQWLKLANLPLPRSGVSACVVGELLYMIGGRNNSPDGNVDSASMDCYDPVINLWRKCPDMSVPRNRVGVDNIDELIYAVGGSHGGIHHNSVERFDPETDTWTLVAPMATRRIGVGVAVVNRLLYAIGGYDGFNRLASMECYHPENDEWRFLAPMNTMRSGAGVASLDQYVYAVGGYDSTYQLPTVERYDVQTNQWEFVAQMSRPRSALNIAVISGKIYALGGYDGNDFLASVEAYDPDQDEWKEVTNMSCGRSGHGVCVALEPCLNGDGVPSSLTLHK